MTKARTLADNFAADINGITAGTGITGGGTSGTVTITNDMATAINAKGDLVVGTGADAYARLAVASTAGYLLSVDSAEATGLKWAAPAGGGGMTLLSTTTLSGTSTSISITPTGYKDLQIYLKDFRWASDANFSFTLNSDTTTYNYIGAIAYYRSVTGNAGVVGSGDAQVGMSYYDWAGGNNNNVGVIKIYDVNNTDTGKAGTVSVNGAATGGANYNMSHNQSFAWLNTAAISSIQIKSNVSFSGGSVEIYGVK